MFWEYDTRTGRRWNQDPKPNPSISNYATFANNPIVYRDILGDSIKANFVKIGKQESYSDKSLKTFLNTKEGYDYLSKFAAKGQTLYGVTFKEEGEYSSKGIDIEYSNFSFTEKDVLSGAVYDKPRGEVFQRTESGRLKIDVKLNFFLDKEMMTNQFEEDYDDALKNGNIKKIDNILLFQRIQTIVHETFIHVDYNVKNRLGILYKKFTHGSYNDDHYTEHMNAKKDNNTLFNTQGFKVMKDLNKKFNTGWDKDKIWYSMFNFQY